MARKPTRRLIRKVLDEMEVPETFREPPPKPKIGRPSSFTQELADLICRRLAEGESLLQICRDDDMPDRHTVIRWKNDNEDFRAQYARAREDQGDAYADLGMNAAITADDPAKGRLAYDAYRWYAGKLKPGTYGDKLQHANAAGDGNAEIVYRWAEPPKLDE